MPKKGSRQRYGIGNDSSVECRPEKKGGGFLCVARVPLERSQQVLADVRRLWDHRVTSLKRTIPLTPNGGGERGRRLVVLRFRRRSTRGESEGQVVADTVQRLRVVGGGR